MAQEGLCSLCGLILSSCLVIRDSLKMLAWKSSSCSCDPWSLTWYQAEKDEVMIQVPDDATSLHYGCFVYSNCAVCFNWMCCWHLDNASHGPWNASGHWRRVLWRQAGGVQGDAQAQEASGHPRIPCLIMQWCSYILRCFKSIWMYCIKGYHYNWNCSLLHQKGRPHF